MYKSINTYLLKIASVLLTIYFIVCSSTTDAPVFKNASHTSVSQDAVSSPQGTEDLVFNFSSPLHPVKAIKPEVIISQVSERTTRILLYLLSFGILYFIFRSQNRQFIAFRNYCKSFSFSIPIFIFCRKLVI
jgi:hypothetical protein